MVPFLGLWVYGLLGFVPGCRGSRLRMFARGLVGPDLRFCVVVYGVHRVLVLRLVCFSHMLAMH